MSDDASILLVDDDPIVRAVLRAQLTRVGHRVREANDGTAALTEVDADCPDIVLLDLGLPGLDGFGVLERLRPVLDGPDAPMVIVLTGTATDTDAIRALSAGAIDVLRKPVAPHELHARLALALRARRAETALRTATRTDRLTNVANRTHTDDHLSMASSAARRHRQSLALLLVDVDHLRRINDARGHVVGDVVLRTVAARAARVLRGEDMVGRWGGEEFLVLAPATDLDGAWRLGERIREAVAADPVRLDDGGELVVTVSIGCAVGQGDDLEDHLRRIERALGQAKAAGRNRVAADSAI